jgi:hypothetical protein
MVCYLREVDWLLWLLLIGGLLIGLTYIITEKMLFKETIYYSLNTKTGKSNPLKNGLIDRNNYHASWWFRDEGRK